MPSHASLRYFRILTNRINRLYHAVLNLRAAYQAQVDIGLNSLMKLFLVIAAVFSPLALILRWYGMNLKMPAFDWQYGHPSIILLNVSNKKQTGSNPLCAYCRVLPRAGCAVDIGQGPCYTVCG